MGDELKKAGDKADTFGKKLAAAAKIAGAAFAAVGTAGTAVGAVIKQSVEAYAEYEQLVGGVNKLFEENGKIVTDNAKKAYATAGMSMNQYMNNAVGLSAFMIESVGRDTQKAAEMIDLAMRDISDNANTYGRYTVEELTGVYQAIAKGQYMTLDNLQLGFAGTKKGVQDLINHANELKRANGELANLTIDKYADIVEAIHLVQVENHISGLSAEEAAKMVRDGVLTQEEAYAQMGTTAKEAATTIQGSLGMAKAAWQNLLVGIGDKEADLGEMIDNLVISAGYAVKNIIPVIQQSLTGIGKTIDMLAPELSKGASELIKNVLPGLVKSAVSILDTFINTIVSNSGDLIAAAIEIIETLVSGLGKMAPMLIQGAFSIISELAFGLADALPVLLPEIANIVTQILITLTSPDNIMKLVNGAIALMQGLTDGFFKAKGVLIQAIPTILQNLNNAIIQAAPQLVTSATELMVQLTTGFIQQLPLILQQLPEIVKIIAQGLIDQFPMLIEAGKGMAKTLWDGFKGLFGGKQGNGAAEAVEESFTSLDNSIKKKASQTASTVTDAFSSLNSTPLDISAATNTATTQIQTFADTATTASSEIASTFSNMGTEISSSISTATSGSTDWSAVVSSAQSAAQNIKAAWKAVPADFRNMVKKIKDAFTELPTYIQEKFSTAASYAVNAWVNVPAEFAAIWQLIKAQFKTTEAYNWGLDMMNNFTSGVAEGQGPLMKLIEQITQEIKDNLGHSVPKKGPLKDDDLWTVHMMDNFLAGIESKRGEVQDALQSTFTAPTFYSGSGMTRTDAIEAKIDRIVGVLEEYIPEFAERQIYLDSGALVGEMLPSIDRGLGRRYAYAERGNA